MDQVRWHDAARKKLVEMLKKALKAPPLVCLYSKGVWNLRVWTAALSSGLVAGVVSGALMPRALWGVFAVLTKSVVHRLDVTSWAGALELMRTPELYAWAAVAVAGTAFQQASFRAGPMTASLPTMTVAEPMVAAVLGVVVLGESLRPDESGWFVLITAVAVMVVSTAALARGEAAIRPPP